LECGWGCVLGLGGGFGANLRAVGMVDRIKKLAEK